MSRPKRPPTRRKRGYRVTSAEKAELLKALREADAGGALPFDDAMAEVERMTDAMIDVVRTPAASSK